MRNGVVIAAVVSLWICGGIGSLAAAESYDEVLRNGHAMYKAENFSGAISQYEKAKSMEPGRSHAYFFVATAMARQKRFDESVAMFNTAANVAGRKDINMHAKALFNVARTYEHAGELQKAKHAWSRYREFALANPEAIVFIDIATQQIELIEAREKRERDYQIVRDRIAKEKKN